MTALVFSAVSFGSNLPQADLINGDGSPSVQGFKIIGIRCGLLFYAMIGCALWLHYTESKSSKTKA